MLLQLKRPEEHSQKVGRKSRRNRSSDSTRSDWQQRGTRLYHLLEVLGKEKVVARIDRALRKIGC